MNELSGLVALAVGLIFFGVYSYRLGIAPTFSHDDYEYTYPSFSLAERGTFGSPLAFHLQRTFDVIGYPAPGQYFQGRWSPAFRAGVREVWGAETLTRVDARPLCWAMGLTFLRPKWVLSWNGDYSVMQPFREFLRRFPDLPGIQVSEARRTPLPPPFGGTVRVYRLGLSDAMDALDRSSTTEQPPCP
jgi:hypothetical protein